MLKLSLFTILLFILKASCFPTEDDQSFLVEESQAEDDFTKRESCVDKDEGCQYYFQNGYCNFNYIITNCKKSCGLCVTGEKKRPDDCLDKSQNCQYYAQAGYCLPLSQYFEIMKEQCKKTCNLCGANCLDKNQACQYFAQAGFCLTSSEYFWIMKEECKKTCNLCGATTPTKPAPTKPAPTKPAPTKAVPKTEEAVLIKNIDDACLKAHNEYRQQHSAQPLKLDKDLIKSAEEYALKLTGIGYLKHSTGNYGENLYYFGSTNSNDDPQDLCQKAVKAWYDEIKDYNFNYPGFNSRTGHFTQVVWRASDKLGMGIAKIYKDGFYYYYAVAQYTPAGNFQGKFRENVLPKY